MEELGKYKQVQGIARLTMEHLKDFIRLGVSEAQIAAEAERFMIENGSDSRFWYHGVGALVLVGNNANWSTAP